MQRHTWTRFVCTFMLVAVTAGAATNALDAASDSAYDGGWADGSNGGSGFGPWQLTTTTTNIANAGHFTGLSTTNGFGSDGPGDTDIDTGGRSWGLYANNGQTASAVRPLVDAPMVPGQTLTFHMDNGFINSGGVVGGGLQNADGQNLFEVFFRGDFNFFEYVDTLGIQTSTIPYTEDGVKVTVTLTSYATYKGRIESLSPAQQFDFEGTLMTPSGGSVIDRVRVFSFNAGDGLERDAFFNSLSLSEAPAPLALEAPEIRAINALPGGDLTVTWSATNQARYDLLISTNLVEGGWQKVPGATDLVTTSDTLTAGSSGGETGFFRVLQSP